MKNKTVQEILAGQDEKVFEVDWDGPSRIVVTEIDPIEDFVTVARVDRNGNLFAINTDMNQMTITMRQFIEMILGNG